jgi:hypothetical protein
MSSYDRRWLIRCLLPILGGCLSASPIIDKSDETFNELRIEKVGRALKREFRDRLTGAKITFTKAF